MSQEKSLDVKLPTKKTSSLRSKTLGRLSILAGSGTAGKHSESNETKGQTWHKQNLHSSLRSVPKPNITWEPGMFTIDYILRNLPLPRVVLCDHSLCDLGKGTMGFDCGQFLMLRSKTENIKVSAGSLAVDVKDGKSLVETDDRLLIPEDYKGWFAVLGKELSLKAIPFYRHVAQLAQSDCHTFLIGGTENVRSVQKVGDVISESRHLCPGDILRMGTLDEDQKLLHCTDENDRDILIPINAQGMFYVMKHKTRQSKVPLLQIKDILQIYKFPCVVKLVFGREPTGVGVFTKIMVLEGVKQEKSVLASTILKSPNSLHELKVDTPNKFRIAVQSKELVLNPGYISALNLCQDQGDLFMRSISMYRQTQGRKLVEPRVSAMGISFASPPNLSNSSESKILPAKVLESPYLTPKELKPTSVNKEISGTVPTASVKGQSTNGVHIPTSENTSKQTSAPQRRPVSSSAGSVTRTPNSSLYDTRPRMPEPHLKQGPQPKSQIQGQTNSSPKSQQSQQHKIQTTKSPVQQIDPQSLVSQTQSKSTEQNGLEKKDSTSSNPRQREPDAQSTPPPPTSLGIQGEKRESQIRVSNGIDKDKNIKSSRGATVQIADLDKNRKSKAARPNAYEEVWTATSVKDDSTSDELSSASSSLSDFVVTSGMGGQIITGGVTPAPSDRVNVERSKNVDHKVPERETSGMGGQVISGGVAPAPTGRVNTERSKNNVDHKVEEVDTKNKVEAEERHHQSGREQFEEETQTSDFKESEQMQKQKIQTETRLKQRIQDDSKEKEDYRKRQEALSLKAYRKKSSVLDEENGEAKHEESKKRHIQKIEVKAIPKAAAAASVQKLSSHYSTIEVTDVSPLPTKVSGVSSVPTKVPEDSPVSTKVSGVSPVPTKEPTVSLLSTKVSGVSPVPTKVTEVSPLPTKVSGVSALPTKVSEVSPVPPKMPSSITGDPSGFTAEASPALDKDPSPSSSDDSSGYATLDMVDGALVVSSEEDDSKSKKKRVSFSDILDVHSIPKQHVTSIEIQESPVEEEEFDFRQTSERDSATPKRLNVAGFRDHQVYTGRSSRELSAPYSVDNAPFSVYKPRSSPFDDSSSPNSAVMDRKGRVKLEKALMKAEVERGKSHEEFARKISLPNMRISDSRDSPGRQRRRDSESDILW